MNLRLTKRAEQDLDDIWLYVRTRNPLAADDLLGTLLKAISELKQYPRLGRRGTYPNTRELVVAGTPYVIAYRIMGTTVAVARVLHGRRAWPKRL